jgi:endogenous inhibitor of DNA gyrase (YacG/DUF329 family)
MSVFIGEGNHLSVHCKSCEKDYVWAEHCAQVPITTGEGPSLQHRISYEVRCPGCDCLEAKWSLAAHPLCGVLPRQRDATP